MSCFIVNPQTIARISNLIADQINGGFNRTNLDAFDTYMTVIGKFVDEVSEKGFAKPELIYKKLYLLNWMAFETRYEYRHSEELDRCSELMRQYHKYNNTLHKPPTGKIEDWHWQMLKSIECYLYQCSEGSELEKSDTFKMVLAMKKAITNYIISHSPEYTAAKWD